MRQEITHICNIRLHKELRINIPDFLERVHSVRAIRTGKVTYSAAPSWYPTDETNWNKWEALHRIVNKGSFEMAEMLMGYSKFKWFVISLPSDLYSWFSSNSLATIQKQIIALLGYLYLESDDTHKRIMSEQLWKYVFEQAQIFANEIFVPKLQEKECSSRSYEEITIKEYREFYQQVCLDFSGGLPPSFLLPYSPTPSYVCEEQFSINFDCSYFTEYDWRIIVKKEVNTQMRGKPENMSDAAYKLLRKLGDQGKEWVPLTSNPVLEKDKYLYDYCYGDTLHRAESSEEMWSIWKGTYQRSLNTQNFVFSLFDKESKTSWLSKRFEILKRDNYRCQICGRGASDGVQLEVDHKHPRARDGSDNDDNLWTLCFDCNRGKRDKDL